MAVGRGLARSPSDVGNGEAGDEDGFAAWSTLHLSTTSLALFLGSSEGASGVFRDTDLDEAMCVEGITKVTGLLSGGRTVCGEG